MIEKIRVIKSLEQNEGYDLAIEQTVKTLIVAAAEDTDSDFIALLIRGDHSLNEIKAENLPQVAKPLLFATEEQKEGMAAFLEKRQPQFRDR